MNGLAMILLLLLCGWLFQYYKKNLSQNEKKVSEAAIQELCCKQSLKYLMACVAFYEGHFILSLTHSRLTLTETNRKLHRTHTKHGSLRLLFIYL